MELLGGAAFEEIETRLGPDRMYFVRFDEPQYDPDGDGPYESSQVLGKYLEGISEDSASVPLPGHSPGG